MICLPVSFPMPSWGDFLSELRIDVAQRPSDIERDLAALHERLVCPGDPLHGLPVLCIRFRNLVFRYRVADGEHYVYVEDVARRRLAGHVVFNRLIELDRRADPHLRAPHARFAADYQRRGIASAVYRWWLDAGNSLISGARQSPGAHALWHSLGGRYELHYVELRDKRLRYLGRQVDERTLNDLHTRIVMPGKGWDLAALAERTGMRLDAGADREVPVQERRLFRRG